MSTPWAPTLTRALAIVLLGALVAAACGDDDDDASSNTTRSAEATTTSTTEPPGTKPAEVEPYIADLLSRLDEVTDQIVRDPAVVLDPEAELIEEFRALYAPDAEGLAGGLNAFRQSAEQGTHLEPLNSDMTRQTSITGAVQTVDENTVKVEVCYVTTHRVIDRNGVVLEVVPGLAQPGEVSAVRIDGEWRLERADIFSNTICPENAPA